MEAVPQSRSLSQGSQSLVMGVTLGKILKVILVPCDRGWEGCEGVGVGSVLHAGDLLCLQKTWSEACLSCGCHAGLIAHCVFTTHPYTSVLCYQRPGFCRDGGSCLSDSGRLNGKPSEATLPNQPAAAQGRATMQAEQCLRMRLYPAPWRGPRRGRPP